MSGEGGRVRVAHSTPGVRTGRMLSVLLASLSDTDALSWPVWTWGIPVAVTTGIFFEPMSVSDPQWIAVLSYVGAGTLMYIVSAVPFAVIYLVRVLWVRSAATRAALAVVAYAFVGLAWGPGNMLVLRAVGAPTSLPVPTWRVAIGSVGMQVAVMAILAVVVWSTKASRQAIVDLADVQAELVRTRGGLEQAAFAARQELGWWIRSSLEPTTETLLGRMQAMQQQVDDGLVLRSGDSDRLVEDLDRFRESVVRTQSRRMHPEARRLGLGVAMQAVLACYPDLTVRLHVDIPGERPPPEAEGLFTRALDIALGAIQVVGTQQPIQGTVSSRPDSDEFVLALPVARALDGVIGLEELRARTESLDGVLSVSVADSSTTLLVRLVRDPHLPTPAFTAEELSIPQIAAGSLAIVSLPMIVALTWDVRTALGCLVCAVLVWPLARLGLRLLPGVLDTNRIGPTAVFVPFVVLPVAACFAAVWALANEGMPWTSPAAFMGEVFVWACITIGGTTLSGRATQRYDAALTALQDANQRVRAECQAATARVDEWRRGVASILHSRIQTRLVAAVAGVQAAAAGHVRELRRAVLALELIARADTQELRRLIGNPGRTQSLDEVVESVRGTSGIEILVTSPGSAGMRVPQAAVLVLQEAVGNALRHGAARRVEFGIEQAGHGLQLTIDDDGCGSGPAVSRGLGLATVDAVTDGHWSLTTSPLGGARLRACLQCATPSHPVRTGTGIEDGDRR